MSAIRGKADVAQIDANATASSGDFVNSRGLDLGCSYRFGSVLSQPVELI
jgi:hypothetical protein